VDVSAPFSPPPPPWTLARKSEPEVDPYSVAMPFPPPPSGTVSTTSTFSVYKTEPEMDLYGVSTLFTPPPPPSHAMASRGWIHGISVPFPHFPPPLHAKASWRWPLSHSTVACPCESALSHDHDHRDGDHHKLGQVNDERLLLPHDDLPNLAGCTAVLIDPRTALARFFIHNHFTLY